MIMIRCLLPSLCITALLWAAGARAADNATPVSSVRDLPYGNALYHYFQNRSLSAITRLLAARERGQLKRQGKDPELLLGNLYYTYGLIPDAVDLFNELLGDDSSNDLRNRVWFNLARVEYDQGRYREALTLLQRLEGKLPKAREIQKNYLLLRLQLLTGALHAARQTLRLIPKDSIWRSYAEYNLGVALIAHGRQENGHRWLLEAANHAASSPDRESQTLSDAARLAAGLTFLRERKWGQAINDLRLVHINGPYSNTAMLATAWSWHNLGNPLQATGLMQAIIKKQQKDPATREAYVALGQIQEQSSNLKLSAHFYEQATRYLQQAAEDIEQTIVHVKSGGLTSTLINEGQIRTHGRDSLQQPPSDEASSHLIGVMASHDFQRQVRYLQQLLDIQALLEKWQHKIPTFQLMLQQRQAAFDARKPRVARNTDLKRIRKLRQQRQQLADEVTRIGEEQDALALASPEEAGFLEQLDKIHELIAQLRDSHDLTEAEEKYRLMKGLLLWDLETTFPRRYWALQRELQLLDHSLKETERAAGSLLGASQRHQSDLADLSRRIEGQDAAIEQQLEETRRLIDEQKKAINDLVVQQLQQLLHHTQQLRLSALYSVARIYDKLTENGKSGGAK